jgi:hypothetical protein
MECCGGFEDKSALLRTCFLFRFTSSRFEPWFTYIFRSQIFPTLCSPPVDGWATGDVRITRILTYRRITTAQIPACGYTRPRDLLVILLAHCCNLRNIDAYINHIVQAGDFVAGGCHRLPTLARRSHPKGWGTPQVPVLVGRVPSRLDEKPDTRQSTCVFAPHKIPPQADGRPRARRGRLRTAQSPSNEKKTTFLENSQLPLTRSVSDVSYLRRRSRDLQTRRRGRLGGDASLSGDGTSVEGYGWGA